MKKLALSLAVLFGVAMVSCGGSDKKECNDSDSLKQAEQVAAQNEENKEAEQVAENDSPKADEATDSVQAQQ